MNAGPNYKLIGIGFLLLIILLIIVLKGVSLDPPYQALFIALPMTLILYGIYPPAKLKATFGPLSVVGPAAVGIFLFIFVWNKQADLKDKQAELEAAKQATRFVVLQINSNADLNNTTLPNNIKVTLLDVDSLDDTKLAEILSKMKNKIMDEGKEEKEVNRLIEQFFTDIIKCLNFPLEGEAINICQDFIKNNADPNINNKWASLVQKIKEGKGNDDKGKVAAKLFEQSLKRTPFAFVKIQNNKQIEIKDVIPGKRLKVGEQEYEIPVIANPKLTITRGIVEAIVIDVYPKK